MNLNQKRALKVQELAHRYLPTYPLNWSSDYKKLVFTTKKSTWANYFLFVALNCIISTGCAYDLLTHFLFGPRPNYNVAIIALHLMCACITTIPAIVATIAFRNGETTTGINTLFSFHETFWERKT